MKYNDNGIYKDVYVKAFDTLPVGTEVDYDGSTVPDGWSEVSSFGAGSIVNLFGNIGDSSETGQFDLYSHIIATKIGNNGVWKFDIEGQMDITNSSSNNNWGISPSKISALLNSAINIQVQYDSALQFLSHWEAFRISNKLPYLDFYGYGTTLQYNDNAYLNPARYYTTSGNVGGYAINVFEDNSYIRATIYLREV